MDQEASAPTELVPPERGYSLVAPKWSPDGRFLAFDEVYLPEGQGMFAYYDFESQEYVRWEQAIGLYAWSPDAAQVAYDNLTYAPNGEERIFLRGLQDQQAHQVSPDVEQGYAFNPVFSPQGDRIAYLAVRGGPDDQNYVLVVQALSGSEPQELGVFEAARALDWTPDGKSLIFSAGPYEAQQIHLVEAANGTVTIISPGSTPALPAP